MAASFRRQRESRVAVARRLVLAKSTLASRSYDVDTDCQNASLLPTASGYEHCTAQHTARFEAHDVSVGSVNPRRHRVGQPKRKPGAYGG